VRRLLILLVLLGCAALARADTNVPVTIGQPFRDGDYPQCVQAYLNGVAVAVTQNDVKSRWPDGSLKYAMISFVIPTYNPGTVLDVSYDSSPNCNNSVTQAQTSTQMLAGGYNFDAQIQVTGITPPSTPNGNNTNISARTILTAANGAGGCVDPGNDPEGSSALCTYWLKGPVVTAVILEDRRGRTFDINTDAGTGNPLHPIFEAWFYPQTNTVQVGYTLENIWSSTTPTSSARLQTYTVAMTIGNSGPTTVYPTSGILSHYVRSRWHKVFTLNPLTNVPVIDHNYPYWATTGFTPNYDPNLVIAPSLITLTSNNFTSSNQALITPNTPTANSGNWPVANGGFTDTGDAKAHGPLTTWDSIYLISQAPSLLPVTLGNADLGNAIIYFHREADHNAGHGQTFDNSGIAGNVETQGRIVSVNARTQVSLLDTSTQNCNTNFAADWINYGTGGQITSPYSLSLNADTSHSGEIGYIAYLSTGQYFYYETVMMQGAYSFGGTNGTTACTQPTANSTKRMGSAGYIYVAQERQMAWAMRDLMTAAFVSVDGSPEKAYLEDKLKANVAVWEGARGLPNDYPSYTTAYSYGQTSRSGCTYPPPYNNNYAALSNSTTLGSWVCGLGAYVLNAPLNQSGTSMPLSADSWFQSSYSTVVLGWLNDLGYCPSQCSMLKLVANKYINTALNPATSVFHFQDYVYPTLDNSGNQITSWTENETFYTQPYAAGPWITAGNRDVDDCSSCPSNSTAALSYMTGITSSQGGYSGLNAYNNMRTVLQANGYICTTPNFDFCSHSPKFDIVPRPTSAAIPFVPPQVATPTFSPPAGNYSSAQSVTIVPGTAGATSCYTTTGATPTTNGAGGCTGSTLTFSTPIAVNANLTIKVIGTKSGSTDSPLGTGAYTILTQPWGNLCAASRCTDWSNVGVLDPVSGKSEANGGGIPNYPTGTGTVNGPIAAYGFPNNSGTVTSTGATMSVNTVITGTNPVAGWAVAPQNLVTLNEGTTSGTYNGQGCPCTFTRTSGDPFNTTGDWVNKDYWITNAGSPYHATISAVSSTTVTFATQPKNTAGTTSIPNGSATSVRTQSTTISSVSGNTFTVAAVPTLAIGGYTFAGAGDVTAIQNAINACSGTPGNGNVVLLGPGTFNLTTSPTMIGIHDCVLRGTNPNGSTPGTVINYVNSGSQCGGFPAGICIADATTASEAGAYPGSLTAAMLPGAANDATWTGASLTNTVTAGTYTPGSTFITLTNVGNAGGGIHNGQPLNLDQEDGALTSSASGGYDFCTRQGSGTYPPTDCEYEFPFGGRGGRQHGTVTVVGTAVTLNSGSPFVTGGAWDNAMIIINGGAWNVNPGSVTDTSHLSLTAQTSGAGAPVNPCATGGQTYLDTTANQLYTCNAAPNPNVWAPISTAAGIPYLVGYRGQTQVVTVVSGCPIATLCTGAGPFTIQISDPLIGKNWSSALLPAAWFPTGHSPNTNFGYNVGVEDMTIDQGFSTVGTNTTIGIFSMNNVWVKGVRSLHGQRSHNAVLYSTHVSIENNYYYGTANASTQSYALESDSNSFVLFENNICQQIVSCMIPDGSTANVYAYNFAIDAFVGNVSPGTVTSTTFNGTVATYTYTGASFAGLGSNPVSVAGTTNGSGIFNVTNVPLNSVSATGFTVLAANLPCSPSCPASVGLANEAGIVHSSNSVMSGMYTTHSDANRYDLVEGNQGSQFHNDNFHGPARTQTAYRNYFGGHEKNITQQAVPFRFESMNRYINMIGNVLGTSGIQNGAGGGYSNYPGCSGCTAGPSWVYSWITFSVPDTSPSTVDPDTFSQSTSFRWGNYDISTGTTKFDTTEVPTVDAFGYAQPIPGCNTATLSCLPASFWRTTSPAFNTTPFGVVAFPSIGPDISGGTALATDMTGTKTPPGGHANDNAASKCFQNSLIDPSYVGFDGGVRLFSEAACYGTTAALPAATLTPATIGFGNQNINTTSGPQSALFSNVGTVPVVVSNVVVAGNFTRSGGTCTGTSFTLAVGASCTILTTFSPTATIAYNGTLTVSSNATGSPNVTNLTGQGTAPIIQWTPTSVNFGNVQLPQSLMSQPINLANVGTGPLNVAITVTGANPAQFVIFSNSCPVAPATLAAGASCNVVINFTPIAAQSYSANLVETDSVQSISGTVTLTGAGVTPQVTPSAPLPVIIE